MIAQITAGEDPLRPYALALKRARQREDSHNADTLYFPGSYERDLFVALAENSRVTVDRIKVCASAGSSATSFESTIWRDLASTGIAIRVVYLVSHLGLVNEVLKDRLQQDSDAGVDVRIIAAHALPDPIAALQLGDTLIVDRHLAVYRNWVHNASRDELGLWTISVSSEHVAQFTRTFEDIWNISVAPTQLPERLDLEEPLVQSAPILAQVAPVLCRGDHVDSQSCDWYHGNWQFLRLMDLVSTPSWHHDFYTRALRTDTGRSSTRVLITGTADYSVFAYVLEAIGSRAESSVTVLDLCHTPLFACQWDAWS